MAGDSLACGGCGTGDHRTIEVPTERLIALAGNPNVGKTTLFNVLTGLRQKVGNYPGVTVEHKTGRLVAATGIDVLDLPGTYSLSPRSLDEEIAYLALTGRAGDRRPDLVVCVVDATNLERNLALALQIVELGLPVIIALNMMDEARRLGLHIDAIALEKRLGIPVVPISAAKKEGLLDLRWKLLSTLPSRVDRKWQMNPAYEEQLKTLSGVLNGSARELGDLSTTAETLRALTSDRVLNWWKDRNPDFYEAIRNARKLPESNGATWQQVESTGRFEYITTALKGIVRQVSGVNSIRLTDRLDRLFTHRIAGPLVFLAVLFIIFQAVFAWATPMMDLIDGGIGQLGGWLADLLPDGIIQNLIVDGVIAGVGAVLVFLPQILLLFFFLGLLEDTGYMARAAFISDRMMSRFGLNGRAVVPLVSGYACAVPAIMATRTIEDHRDRLVAMMVIPLMSCSARLPIYTLMIAAFVPATKFGGVIALQGIVLFGIYMLSTLMALTAALVLKKVMFRGPSNLLMIELPPYRLPQMKLVTWRMVDRARIFITKAGKVILLMSLVLWFLAAFPRYENPRLSETERASEQIRQSYVGKIGHAIEPVMRPLGFDWKISAGLVTAFAAREVLVSTLATIYSVGDADENNLTLHEKLRNDTYPGTDRRVFTPLVALSLIVFFMLASQCMSTLAITRRETNSWRWPAFMFGYMTMLAYLSSLIVYQGGLLLGFS